MRVRGRCKLPLAGAVLVVALGGCLLLPIPTAPPPAPGAAETPAPHSGTPYDIVAADSLLTIRVYRGGTLASVGHNHLIASHDLAGTIYVPAELLRSSFEVHVPVATLTVDEAALRAAEASADFPPDVSESAKEGTRRNMLGEALLDAGHNPEIALRAVRLETAPPPAAGAAVESALVLARVQSTVRGTVRTFSVPVRYERAADNVVASGELALRQTDLGLTPFSAMLGALQVEDEMRIRFRIVAHAAPTAHQGS
jgi:polyisoprenoid-binding protein YceI